MITRETLKQAAQEGLPLEHLTAGQVYAADKLNIAIEHLQQPLKPMIWVLLHRTEEKAREAFFGGIDEGDAEAMINRSWDETQPAFLRLPVRQSMEKLFNEHFPDLKPDGVSEEGNPVYSLGNLARNLGASEEDLLAHAKENGLDQHLYTGNVHTVQ